MSSRKTASPLASSVNTRISASAEPSKISRILFLPKSSTVSPLPVQPLNSPTCCAAKPRSQVPQAFPRKISALPFAMEVNFSGRSSSVPLDIMVNSSSQYFCQELPESLYPTLTNALTTPRGRA